TIPGTYTDIKAEIVNDASIEVRTNISTLSSSAVLGIILVFLTLFIFIGWRNAIFAAMGIPFSFLMTFWIMNFFGITINNLSLFALVLILGMVVDDAIVVIENVHRNIEEGMTPKEAAIKGAQEVMWPVIAAVLTTISAFLPILMMEGNMGKFLSEFPKVVMIALAASLFEALFILPSHLADFSKAHDDKAKRKTKNGFYSKLVNKYSIVLKGFLKQRLLSLTILSIVFVISVSTVVLGLVKFEFFPSSTPKTLVIQVKTLPGNSLAQTDSLTYLLEKKILGLEYKRNFETLNSNIGQMQERRNWEESSNYVELRLDLLDADSLTVEVSTIRKDIREYLETIPEIMSYKFSTEAHGPPTGNDVELRVLGDDLAKLQEHSNRIKSVLAGIKGVTDIEDSFDAGKKEMRIYPDYDKLAINGMTVAELASFIRIASTGKVVSEFTERSDKYDIRIKLQNDQFENVQDVENLKLTTKIGKKIYLKDIVKFEINTSLSQIEHRGGRRMIEITANSGTYSDNGEMKKRTPNEINQILFGNKIRNVKGALSSFEKDNSGYTIDIGGASDQKKKSFNSLYLAFLVAVILIYMILGTQFKSYIQPIIVMVTIPFAFIGVIAGLFFTNTPFSLLSLIAVLALAGIVVNDSIVLVDFINKERDKGVDRWNSLINAGKIRLRPILLTSITTIFGLVPMMISTSESVAMWKPMAVSISFGLAFATILTLLVLPVIYS
ncbi:MAG: efflux RND transporter permease subunit, partial [Candidatus Delongbacteria bacterium]|nr:efflux RND transporter permease subunit [Candidatus Delongbacteria bacterium]